MMSKLVGETKLNNSLLREHFGKGPHPKNNYGTTFSSFKEKTNLPLMVPSEQWSEADLSPMKKGNETMIEDVIESQSGTNIRPKLPKNNSKSSLTVGEQRY